MSEFQILLVGMPRSGTSWVSKIFDSHPDVAYFHEPDSSIKLDFLNLIDDRDLDESTSTKVRETLTSFWDLKEERVIGSLPIFRKSYLTPLQLQIYRLTNSASKYSARVLGVPLALPHRPIRGAAVKVWKSIESLGRVAQLKQAMGDSLKVVQIARHPAGQVYSTLSGEARKQFGSYQAAEDEQLFREILDTKTAAGLGLSFDSFSGMTPSQRLAAKWAIYNDHAIESGACDFILNYESLCRSPLPLIKQVFSALGMGLTPEVERFIVSSTSKNQSRYYSVFKDPLASSMKWKEKLDDAQKAQIAAVLKDSRAYRMFEGTV
jgi:hypothetical protein